MPRLTTSSANSVGVQCVTGRSDSAGGSQATTMIWHSCSAVNVAGAPGRGWSAKAACTRPLSSFSSLSASAAASPSAALNHRLHHWLTVCQCSPSSSAMCCLRAPAAACKMILARVTNHCGLFARRTNCSNIVRCRSLNVIGWGCGPLGFRFISDKVSFLAFLAEASILSLSPQ